MKNLFFYLVVLVSLILCFEKADAALYRKTANGGVNGYKYTREILFLYISCWDPGNSTCPKSIIDSIPTPPHQVAAVQWALDQIANGDLTGSTTQGVTNIEWSATNTEATTSDIIVWDNNEAKPEEPVNPFQP